LLGFFFFFFPALLLMVISQDLLEFVETEVVAFVRFFEVVAIEEIVEIVEDQKQVVETVA